MSTYNEKSLGAFLRGLETKGLDIGKEQTALPRDLLATKFDGVQDDLSFFRQHAQCIQTSNTQGVLPIDETGQLFNTEWSDEANASQIKDTTKKGKLKNIIIPTHLIMANIPVSEAFMQDVAFELTKFVSDRVNRAMAIQETMKFLHGTGENEPFGLLSNIDDKDYITGSNSMEAINEAFWSLDSMSLDYAVIIIHPKAMVQLRSIDKHSRIVTDGPDGKPRIMVGQYL
jgi:HK97 family phage major capsid protein